MGLTPSLLAALGPSVGEISLLSSRVPVLSLLITLGAPAIYPTRVLDYDDPEKVLKAGPTMPLKEPGGPYAIIILEYILAVAAVVNVLHNSWQLGDQTVFAPVCNGTSWTLLWSLIPLGIHLIAAIAYNAKIGRFRIHKSAESHREKSLPGVNKPYTTDKDPASSTRVLESGGLDPQIHGTELGKQIDYIPLWSKALNSIATGLSFIHVTFGILVFSSLQFICPGDAVGVLGRYISSAAVCRWIIMIEFARMRRRIQTSHELDLKQ